MTTKFIIDPVSFTDSQWEEFYNASAIMPRTYEVRRNAKPFKRSRKQIRDAVQDLESKARYVLDGGLGDEDEHGQDERWASDLREGADILLGIIGEAPALTRRDKLARLKSLLREDIYTDAHEYRERVEEVQDLVEEVF